MKHAPGEHIELVVKQAGDRWLWVVTITRAGRDGLERILGVALDYERTREAAWARACAIWEQARRGVAVSVR